MTQPAAPVHDLRRHHAPPPRPCRTPTARRGGGSVLLGQLGLDHRRAVLQGQHRQRWHPRRSPLDGIGHLAGLAAPSPPNRRRDGRACPSPPRYRSPRARPTSSPTTRRTATTPATAAFFSAPRSRTRRPPPPSGRYRYGSGGAFPTTTSAGNYWVDVTFSTSTTDTTPPTVTTTGAAAGATGVATPIAVTATLSEAIASGATLSLTRSGTAVAHVELRRSDADDALHARFDAGVHRLRGHAQRRVVTGRQRDGRRQLVAHDRRPRDAGGRAVHHPDSRPGHPGRRGQRRPGGRGPASPVGGSITGVRFYKGGSANGGTHIGRLWTASGTLLASATFQGELAGVAVGPLRAADHHHRWGRPTSPPTTLHGALRR